jgi:O-methyltransferase
VGPGAGRDLLLPRGNPAIEPSQLFEGLVLRSVVKQLLRRTGYQLVRYLPDLTPEDRAIIERVLPCTMTSPEGVFGVIQSVRHVAQRGIPGAIVECGVWRGGCMMAAAYALQSIGRSDVDLYLFDTYEGMTRPTEVDVNVSGLRAMAKFERVKRSEESSTWCYASLDEVRRNLLGTGYPESRLVFVKGRVETTVPARAPAEISILRLDTDWYESTLHELVQLYPRLAGGGVLLLDDYGHWQGCRRAVDEYFSRNGGTMLLNRLDYAGRIGVKTLAD